MRVLHVSSLSTGGAFNSAYRLHQGLQEIGVESSFLTLSPLKSEGPIQFPNFGKYGLSVCKRVLNKVGFRDLNAVKRVKDFKSIDEPIEAFTSPFSDYKVGQYIIDRIKPDLINLHWCANFIDYNEFFDSASVPIVWTLHDEQPFSAYWHYSEDRIETVVARELEEKYLKMKTKGLSKFNQQIQIVAPSQWLLNKSKKSRLFRDYPHQLIRYGLDTNIYKLVFDAPASFEISSNNLDKVKLLFICQSVSNQRKGMGVLLDALTQLDADKYQLIAVGEVSRVIQDKLDMSIVFTGSITDPNELAKVYNYCDAMVIPSRQDNLPNTMLESLCCGTPVIGTPAGGISEILNNPTFGILSESHNYSDLAKAIHSFSHRHFDASIISDEAARLFKLDNQANRYLAVYKDLLKEKKV